MRWAIVRTVHSVKADRIVVCEKKKNTMCLEIFLAMIIPILKSGLSLYDSESVKHNNLY